MGIIGGVAAIGVAGSIGGSIISSNAAGKAANDQSASDNAAISQQQKEFNQEQANEAPYLQAGDGALGQLSTLYGLNAPSTAAGGAAGGTNAAGGASTVDPNASFYLSPDYNFTLTQGLKGLTAQGAATNGTDNGATDKAEIAYAGNLAAGQYDNYKSGLMSLAGLGSSAAGSVNSSTAGTSNSISSADQTQGSNSSSAALGQGASNAGTVSNATSIAQQFLNSQTDSSSLATAGIGNSLGNNGTDSSLVSHQGGF